MKFELNIDDVNSLYGDKFFDLNKENVLPDLEIENPVAALDSSETHDNDESPSVEWKLKINSQILFILHPEEYSNKSYAELLKKIVVATGIQLANAGFGIIRSGITETEMENFPCKFAVVFDKNYNPSYNSMLKAGDNHIWFSHKLEELQQNESHKRELLAYVKEIIQKLNSPDA